MEAFNGFDEERSPAGEDSVECLQCESAEGHHNAHYDHPCQKVICVCGGGWGVEGECGGEGRGSVMGRERECDGNGGGVMGREGKCDAEGREGRTSTGNHVK